MNPMALDRGAQAALALHRFGLGPREGSIAAIASDPRGALLAELDRPDAGRIEGQNLRSGGEVARTVHQYAIEQRARAEKQPAGPETGPASALPNPSLNVPQQIYLAEVKARYDAATSAEIGFVERLVWFWSNHFASRPTRAPCAASAGAYEREAIRPHVLGRFAECCSRPSSIRRCCSISTTPSRSARIPRPASRQSGASTRTSPARSSSCIRSASTAATRRTTSRGCAEVLTGWTISPFATDAGERRRVPLQSAAAMSPARDDPRQDLRATAAWSRAEAVLPTSRAIRPPRAHRDQARAAFRRRRSAAGAGRATDAALCRDATATSQLAAALVERPRAWSAPREKLLRPDEWLDRRHARRPVSSRPKSRRCHAGCSSCWDSRCGGRRRRRACPTASAAWLDGAGAADRHRRRARARSADRRDAARARSTSAWARCVGGNAPDRRGVPRAARRRWRCC